MHYVAINISLEDLQKCSSIRFIIAGEIEKDERVGSISKYLSSKNPSLSPLLPSSRRFLVSKQSGKFYAFGIFNRVNNDHPEKETTVFFLRWDSFLMLPLGTSQ